MIATVENQDIYGYTIFCEDVRQEVGGKVSYMGVYQGVMQVHTTFPAVLPRFVFVVHYVQRKSIFQPKVELRIYLPGDADEKPSLNAEVDSPQEPDKMEADSLPYVALKVDFAMVGLTLKQPGTIRVRAFRDGKLYPLGALAVVQGSKIDLDPNAPGGMTITAPST